MNNPVTDGLDLVFRSYHAMFAMQQGVNDLLYGIVMICCMDFFLYFRRILAFVPERRDLLTNALDHAFCQKDILIYVIELIFC